MTITLDQGIGLAGVIISGFVAIGTILLAINALRTIKGRSKEVKVAKLDEIIDWATEITTWNIDTSVDAQKFMEEAEDPYWAILSQLFRLRDGFTNLKRKGETKYRPIAITMNQVLANKVDKLNAEVQKHTELIGLEEIATMKAVAAKGKKIPDDISAEIQATQNLVAKHKLNELTAAVDNVLNEASTLKTKL